jgi:hypothetical protein
MANKNVKYGDGFADITLSREFSIGGTKTKTLRMREPTVKDQRAARMSSDNDAERDLNMFANLCEVAPSELETLPLRDYGRLQDAFLGFID